MKRRPVKGYEGLYEVSDDGRVFSTDKLVKTSFHGTKGYRLTKGKELRPIDHGNGYLYVSLTDRGVRKNHYIHRLVAEAFIPNSDNLPVVNHIDYDKKNNSVSNLEWCTQKENVSHSVDSMCKPRRFSLKSNKLNEKNIAIRHRGNNTYYEVLINWKNKANASKTFKTLEEAKEYRDEIYKIYSSA